MPYSFEEVYSVMDSIIGHMYKIEARLLYELAQQVPAGGIVVEVGSDLGRSSCVWLMVGSDKGFVPTLVDNFSYPYNSADQLRENLSNINEAQYTLLAMESAKAATQFEDNSIDLFFLDAGHADPEVESDCAAWIHKIKSGGIAIFHDYGGETFPGLTQIVDKYTEGWEVIGTAPLLVAKQKPS